MRDGARRRLDYRVVRVYGQLENGDGRYYDYLIDREQRTIFVKVDGERTEKIILAARDAALTVSQTLP